MTYADDLQGQIDILKGQLKRKDQERDEFIRRILYELPGYRLRIREIAREVFR